MPFMRLSIDNPILDSVWRRVNLPFEDSLTPTDLDNKGLHVLRVECEKYGRSGRYGVIKPGLKGRKSSRTA